MLIFDAFLEFGKMFFTSSLGAYLGAVCFLSVVLGTFDSFFRGSCSRVRG